MLTHPGKMYSSVCFTLVCRGPGYQHNNSPETRRTRRLEIRRWLQHTVQCSLRSEQSGKWNNEQCYGLHKTAVSIHWWRCTADPHNQIKHFIYWPRRIEAGLQSREQRWQRSVIVISRCWPITSRPSRVLQTWHWYRIFREYSLQ